jgi:polyhydroxyalkanoate synthesis repressor PhaR
MAILIKRYANRKLYNTDTSRYITLKGVAKLLDEGVEVRVVDNETGEDITQVALSQILVDNKRAREDPSDTLLSQILSRGGDALYGAIRKSVDDATDGLGDFQDRFRELVGQGGSRDSHAMHDRDFDDDQDELTPRIVEEIVRDSVQQVIESLDLPRRRDLDTLNRNFERVAKAVERLERAYLPPQQGSTHIGTTPKAPKTPEKPTTSPDASNTSRASNTSDTSNTSRASSTSDTSNTSRASNAPKSPESSKRPAGPFTPERSSSE